MKKKRSQRALIDSPGRWTGNNIFPKGGLTRQHRAPRRSLRRPQEVHTDQGLNVGLYTSTMIGGISYLSWFYDRRAIKDPAHTGTSKGLSQAINRGPIRKYPPNYANVYKCNHSEPWSQCRCTHCVTANEVRNGLVSAL